MRPVFGDVTWIEQVDPYRKLLKDGMTLPPKVVGCPECDKPLHIDFNDRWVNGDEFGAGTIEWYCTEHGWPGYSYQDQVMRDEQKIVRWIQSQHPTFKHEC